MPSPIVPPSRLRARRNRTLARLRRVNAALARRDAIEAASRLPADQRPRVRAPVLGRRALKDLRRILAETIREQEEMWERRN